MRIASSVLFFLFCISSTNAQTERPTKSNFIALMKNFQKQQIEIRKALTAVNLKELTVSYAWGRQIDQYIDSALSQLDILSQSTLKPTIGDDLAEEMLLLEETQEVNTAMLELSDFLSDPSITHDASAAGKANTWARSITAANALLSTFYTDAFHYSVWHARDVQNGNCVAKANQQ